jgi:hypothetical protein
LLLGDYDSGADMPQDKVGRYLDISEYEPPFEALAAALGVPVEARDEYAFEVVRRALEALGS